MSFDADAITAFTGLAHTCDTLPVVPLLASLAGASCPTTLANVTQANLDGFGSWLDSNLDCSLAELKILSAAVDAACCLEQGDCTNGSGPGACTAECGGKLLSMISSCPDTLNLVFDGLGDGVYDGSAQTILDQRDDCLHLPASDVIEAIEAKQAAGCTLEVEGLGETQVNDASCDDVGPEELCALVGEGTLHCAADFCPDDCTHANQCDLTCGFCSTKSKGYHHHQSGRRREQIVINADDTCNPSEFEAKTNAVNDACW